MMTQHELSFLINTKKFEVRIPEYYDLTVPDYFKKPVKKSVPMVNGQPVDDPEDYYKNHPEAVRDEDFVPSMLFKDEEYNMTISMMTVIELVDLIDNNVLFDIVDLNKIEEIIDILNSYITVMFEYEKVDREISIVMPKIKKAKEVIKSGYDSEMIRRRKDTGIKRHMSLLDMIKWSIDRNTR